MQLIEEDQLLLRLSYYLLVNEIYEEITSISDIIFSLELDRYSVNVNKRMEEIHYSVSFMLVDFRETILKATLPNPIAIFLEVELLFDVTGVGRRSFLVITRALVLYMFCNISFSTLNMLCFWTRNNLL